MNGQNCYEKKYIFERDDEGKKLNDLLSSVGISLDSRKTGLLLDYSELIFKWNMKSGLVSKNDAGSIMERHIFESLLLSKTCCLSEDIRLLDMGAGAGLPGIPLKIWNDKIELTLIESNRKKALFLEYAADTLGLGSVKIFSDRIEDLGGDQKMIDKFDVVTARALAPLVQLLEWAKPFLNKNGKCVFPKGSRLIEEIEDVDMQEWKVSAEDQSKYLSSESGKEKFLHVAICVLTNT